MTGAMGAEQRERIERRSALRRLAGVDDVAAAVEYLLSDSAKNITGTTITVDAGSIA
jgi:3-oxoacyl-[acyl-carrier protein] reductase